jgi:hypothetical protein
VSSTSGLIGFDTDGSGFSAPARFLSTFQDLDRDGINDCQESRAGREGYGCYVVDPVTNQVPVAAPLQRQQPSSHEQLRLRDQVKLCDSYSLDRSSGTVHRKDVHHYRHRYQ